MTMLMASPLFQQINDIQDLLDKTAQNSDNLPSDTILGKR